jgi:hypothetical protein
MAITQEDSMASDIADQAEFLKNQDNDEDSDRDQLIKDVEERIAEDTVAPEMEGDDDAVEPEVGISEGEIDSSVSQRAQATYGLSPDEVESFGTTQALEAAMRIWDKRILDAYRQNQTPPPNESLSGAAAPNAAPPQPPQRTAQAPTSPAPFEVEGLDELPENDPIRRGMEALVSERNTLAQRLDQITEYLVYQGQNQQQQMTHDISGRFQSALDAMDTEVYGKSGSLTPAQQQARGEAEQNFWPFANQESQQVADWTRWDYGTLASRAANATHADKLYAQKTHKRAAEIRQRSSRRTSATSRRRGTSIVTAEGKRQADLMPSDDAAFMAQVMERIEKG